jgi:hypothetical protein
MIDRSSGLIRMGARPMSAVEKFFDAKYSESYDAGLNWA